MFSISPTQATAILALLTTSVHGHMILGQPVPFDFANSATQQSPLEPDGSDFPCKFPSGFEPEQHTQNEPMAPGSSNELSFIGGATHGGGSCQVSLTTDTVPTKDSKWEVIHSIEGGCPSDAEGNLSNDAEGTGSTQFSFDIPSDMEPGKYTLAWTWFNKIGNREMYMNCAPIEVSGGSAKRQVTKINKKRQSGRPEMMLANIGNGCSTEEGSDVEFPDPGDSLEKSEGANLQAPSGDCGSASSSAASDSSSSSSSDEDSASPSSASDSSSSSSSDEGSASPSSASDSSSSDQSSSDEGSASPSSASDSSSSSSSDEDSASPSSASDSSSSGPSDEESASPSSTSDSSSSDQSSSDEGSGAASASGSAPDSYSSPSATPGSFAENPTSTGDEDAPSAPDTGDSSSSSTASAPAGGASVASASGGGAGTPGASCSDEGQWVCAPDGLSFTRCASGVMSAPVALSDSSKCVPGQSKNLDMVPKVKRSLRFDAPHAARANEVKI